MNGATATADDDGAATIDLDIADHGDAEHLPVMDGWSDVVRMYRPHSEILEGRWSPPAPTLVP